MTDTESPPGESPTGRTHPGTVKRRSGAQKGEASKRRRAPEGQPDDVKLSSRRLPCLEATAECPTRAGLKWACSACAALQLGRPIDDAEAEVESRLLVEAQEIWERTNGR